MTPVVALSVRPVGSAPDVTLNVYGAVPPVACSMVLYAVPTVPAGGLPLTAIAVPPAVIVICRDAVTVSGTSLESVAWITNDDVPETVGVPEITPVEALKVRPAGSVPLASDSFTAPVPPDVVNVAE